MSLHDIFAAITAQLQAIATAIWRYPIPWGDIFAVMIMTAAAIFIVFLIVTWWRQIKLAWIAYKKPDTK